MVRRAATRATRRALAVFALACVAPLWLGSLCGGSGDRGRKAVEKRSVDAECAPLFGQFPPGLAPLPGGDRAVVATGGPQTLIAFELGASPPRNVGPAAPPPFPADSDGDGEADHAKSLALGFGVRTPILGRLGVASDALVLASASGYEQVLAYAPMAAALAPLDVTNPAASGAHDPADHPFLPAAGETATRTAVATRVCVRPPEPFDSAGRAIEAGCDAGAASFYTSYTAHQAVVGDLLIVATSNLASSAEARFRPGTLLLFELDASQAVPHVQPLVERPVVFTTHFNPTSVTAWRTLHGRELALVGSTGAIALSSGAGSVRSDSAIEVFDVTTRRIAATIPLGPAALDFGGLSISSEAGIAVAGSATRKQIHAVDLAVLDDERIFQASNEVVLLDGSDPDFPDARIFSGDAPLAIPRRPGGPDPAVCDGWTNALIGPDRDGEPEHLDVYVTDRCDGTLTLIDVDLTGADELPLSASRFAIERQLALEAANVPANVGRPMEPSQLVLGPAGHTPGLPGPHLYYVRNMPTADFCALEIGF